LTSAIEEYKKIVLPLLYEKEHGIMINIYEGSISLIGIQKSSCFPYSSYQFTRLVDMTAVLLCYNRPIGGGRIVKVKAV
jgi:alpha-N-acetylglucosamine transferase